MYNSIHKKYIKELFPLNEVWPALAVAGATGYGLYKYGKKAGKYLAKKAGDAVDYAGKVKDALTGDNFDPLKNMTMRSDFKSDKEVKTDKVKEGLSKLIDNQKSESILHYSDAKGTRKYSEGYKAAKDGVEYDENPYSGIEKLQWSRGHNDERADRLSAAGEPNYGARGQFENRQVKGSDPMPKAKPGRTDHPYKGMLVGSKFNEESEFSEKQIKMAFGILNDPRYKDGNYSGAVKAIEKLAKGLSEHPSVANALKRANESIEK
jgi:ribosome modulation factor